MVEGQKLEGRIQFILTGGSLDSHIEPPTNEVVPHEHSIIEAYMARFKFLPDAAYAEICMKDSRHISQADRGHMARVIVESPHKLFIVTHGLATLENTAQYLSDNVAHTRDDATIVLAGSKLPITDVAHSDGPLQLGYAIAQVRSLQPGIYLCNDLATQKISL